MHEATGVVNMLKNDQFVTQSSEYSLLEDTHNDYFDYDYSNYFGISVTGVRLTMTSMICYRPFGMNYNDFFDLFG